MQNWPWYRLHDLHIRITWFSLYGIHITMFFLYGFHMPLFPHMVIQPIVLVLLWAAMDSSLSQGPLLWCHNYVTIIVPRNRETWTWARHPTTPWQRECTVITDCQSIDPSLDSVWFVTHFWEITPYILRDWFVGYVQSPGYSINARAFGLRTPYRVGGLAGDIMRAWQRECTAITDCQSIDPSLDSVWFVTHFWEITPYILRDGIVGYVQSPGYSINARAFSLRTPYRVGGLAGDIMRALVSHSMVNHWIYHFRASLLLC